MDAIGLQVDGVSKRFAHRVKGEIYAARDVKLDVGPGEFLTLLGPSGCGKTTTLRMIAGFEVPDAGRIRFDGQDVTALPANQRNIGFVFQRSEEHTSELQSRSDLVCRLLLEKKKKNKNKKLNNKQNNNIAHILLL